MIHLWLNQNRSDSQTQNWSALHTQYTSCIGPWKLKPTSSLMSMFRWEDGIQLSFWLLKVKKHPQNNVFIKLLHSLSKTWKCVKLVILLYSLVLFAVLSKNTFAWKCYSCLNDMSSMSIGWHKMNQKVELTSILHGFIFWC